MPVGAPAARATAWVDTDALARNCRRLADRLGPRRLLCAVVKANGYGHGFELAARAALAGGARWLAVASADEALALRDAGFDTRTLVMGALSERELADALRCSADVVVWELGFVERVAQVAQRLGVVARCHIKLDTGMGRLGTRSERTALACAELVATRPSLELAGAMTHFATADELDDDGYFDAQLERFTRFVATLREALGSRFVAHAANSAAVFRDPRSHFDMARCGIAIYGLDPFHEDAHARGLEPVLTLESYLACVKQLDRGESVGYGRTWRAERPTRVGIVPIGYGDGIRRALSNRGWVLVGGRRRPIVGTISMDNLAVDLGPRPEGERIGEPVVLIGGQGEERISAEEVARLLGTINYEVATALAARVRRLPLSRRAAELPPGAGSARCEHG